MGIQAELTKFIWYIKGLDQRQKEQPPFLESRGYRKGLELGSEHGIAPPVDNGRGSEEEPANIGWTAALDKSRDEGRNGPKEEIFEEPQTGSQGNQSRGLYQVLLASDLSWVADGEGCEGGEGRGDCPAGRGLV